MSKSLWHYCKHTGLVLLTLAAIAGWLFVVYIQNRSREPMEIVKKHFVFYPEYSHGTWREAPCGDAKQDGCRDVTYTISLAGCGPVTFDWRVSQGEDADSDWTYNGPRPKLDESEYPLYAVLSEDSRLIDSPALGKPLPQTCHSK
jgi:hypothetical protein